jgi:benzoyl-CoA reductase/2-hydroxyglutaryl-CoA dehydratase subunit BcrC/BadD/HgdB
MSTKSEGRHGVGIQWFAEMIPHCSRYVRQMQKEGKPIVGILCEYTPRELILAAGAVPVCLCGGSAMTIPAAEQYLPANLCPLIKSTYGYSVLGTNPFLELASLIVGETTCDGKKKMYELLAERHPMYVLEIPQKPHLDSGLTQWRASLEEFKQFLEHRFDVVMRDADLRHAIAVMNRERRLRRALAELMRGPHPPMTGRQLIDLKSSVSGFPQYLAALESALAESRSSVPASGHDGRIRVLMTGVPMVHGAEWVLELIESRGGLVVCQENCTGIKPVLEDVDENDPDPIHALAVKYYHLPCSVMTSNDDRLDLLRQLVLEYQPNCIIELVWQACITYDVESYRVKRLAREELDLPYLRIETDYSVSDSARIGVRVDALFESIQQRCAPTPVSGSVSHEREGLT